jgi:hypothetical protein
MGSLEEAGCNDILHKTRGRVVPILECVANSQGGREERGGNARSNHMVKTEGAFARKTEPFDDGWKLSDQPLVATS